MIKPPVGLIPQEIWRARIYADRHEEVTAAIERYQEAGLEYPITWDWERKEILSMFSTASIEVTKKQADDREWLKHSKVGM